MSLLLSFAVIFVANVCQMIITSCSIDLYFLSITSNIEQCTRFGPELTYCTANQRIVRTVIGFFLSNRFSDT